jgi:hypothetical protein
MSMIHRTPSLLHCQITGLFAALLALAAPAVLGANTLLPEPDLSVRAIAQVPTAVLQPDGKLLIGGNFGQVNGQPRRWLARLNSDGSLDASFAPTLSNAVTRIVIAGNFIYVAGAFALVDGQQRQGLARFALATGALDAWTMDANDSVEAIDSDGTYLYVGGPFSLVGGQPRQGLGRIVLSTGALDPTWVPSLTGTTRNVRTFAFSGGYVYVGGWFTEINGQARSNLARLSLVTGAVDPAFNPDPDQTVTALLSRGSNLYVGGWMSRIGGAATSGLARIDAATGVADPSFRPALGQSVFAVIADGTDLIVGGAIFPRDSTSGKFTSVVRVDANTGAIRVPGEPDWNEFVYALALGPNTLYAVGAFEGVAGAFTRSIARLNPATLVRDPVDLGATADGKVLALLPLSDGRVVIGGNFNEVNGKRHKNLALLGADGSINHGWAVGTYSIVNALATDGAYVYIGSNYSLFDGGDVHRLGRIALATLQPDASFAPQLNNAVQALAVNAGHLYVGGAFTTIDGQSKSRLARFALAGGSLDGAWSPNPDGAVLALLPSGSDLIVGGAFANIGGQPRTAVAKVSGSTGLAIPGFNSDVSSAGAQSKVRALAASGNALYLGGEFDKVGGVTHSGIARVDIDTGLQSASFTASLNGSSANALAATPSALFAGYTGTAINAQPQPGAASLNPVTGVLDSALTGATLSAIGSSVQVNAIALTAGKVWFGGWFDRFAGQPRGSVAAWGTLTPAIVTVFEFYAPSLNHYFRTAIAEEAAALTANPALGFLPTGNDFRAYLRSAYPADAKPVCRFYGSVSPGPNSHFYTAEAAECTALKNLQFTQPTTQPRWNFEEIAFAINLPTGPGACPATAPVKVYRAYNNRAAQGDSNHRFTTDITGYNQLVAQNWIGEDVVMCALP